MNSFTSILLLTVFLLFFISAAFYSLAKEYNKNKWLYPLAGLAICYAGTFLGRIVIGILWDMGLLSGLENLSQTMVLFIQILTGMLVSLGFYTFLKSRWSKEISKF